METLTLIFRNNNGGFCRTQTLVSEINQHYLTRKSFKNLSPPNQLNRPNFQNFKVSNFNESLSFKHLHKASCGKNFTGNVHDFPKSSFICKAMNDQKPSEPSVEAKMRDEVIYPFRTLRMVIYLAFIASAGIGSLIAFIKIVASLSSGSGFDGSLNETINGFAIDAAAVGIFAFLYSRDVKAKNLTLARLTREENLSSLRVELANKRIFTLGDLRGSCRVIIISGSKEFLDQALIQSQPYKSALIERGVLVVPFCTDGSISVDSFVNISQKGSGFENDSSDSAESDKRWMAIPLYTNEWKNWINEQKGLAKVGDDKPVYISLRIDGRVRASGVGCPSWQIIAAQLPPLKGIWAGALDGMDGRV